MYKQYGSDFINKEVLGSQWHNEYLTQLPYNQKPIAISEYIKYIDGVDKNNKLFHYYIFHHPTELYYVICTVKLN